MNYQTQQQSQNILKKIKKLTWDRFQENYLKKFKKSYNNEDFIILASIYILQKGQKNGRLIAVGIGTKSLPFSVINQDNKHDLIDDMHAQMLAIQGFKRFLLQQMSKPESNFLIWDAKKSKYLFNPSYQLYLYCSQIFCGDCCINEQYQSFSGAKPLKYLHEKSYNQEKYTINILRTKPGRLDLPIEKRSHILSCSDLIAFYNILGIQGKKLFSMVHPIYIDKIILQCNTIHQNNIKRGINIIDRLMKITKRSQTLIKRQIFNIMIQKKERIISRQFINKQPQVFILEKQQTRNKQGFQLCGIFTQNYTEWINGKTGLPQGSSLKNYKEKGRISKFSQAQLIKDFPFYLENQFTFKYEAIQNRFWFLFNSSVKFVS